MKTLLVWASVLAIAGAFLYPTPMTGLVALAGVWFLGLYLFVKFIKWLAK